MTYIITEKRDNDRFVIYDKENKGSACVSKYTIKQLIEDGCIVIGVIYSFKRVGTNEVKIDNIELYSKNGKDKLHKAVKNEFVPDTKRSFATVRKGLTPSRAEKKALNEKAKKTLTTKKANVKAKKAAEEQALQEKKERELQRKKDAEKMSVIRKRVQKSKPQLYLRKKELMATEYDYKTNYEFDVEIRSASALTKLNNLIKSSTAYADVKNAGLVIKRGGIFRTKLYCDDRCLILDDTTVQMFAAKEVWFDFDGNYENRCEIRFSEYNQFVPEFTYTHGTTFTSTSSIGPDAYSVTSAEEEAKFLRKRLGRPIL